MYQEYPDTKIDRKVTGDTYKMRQLQLSVFQPYGGVLQLASPTPPQCLSFSSSTLLWYRTAEGEACGPVAALPSLGSSIGRPFITPPGVDASAGIHALQNPAWDAKKMEPCSAGKPSRGRYGSLAVDREPSLNRS
jgi:hypothetical protein